ncbi:MAG: hypothetical protein ACLFSR_03895 [Halomonas sp.]
MSQTVTRDFSHLGTGELMMRRRGSGAPFIPVGNASEVKFAVSTDEKTQRDYRTPGGGTRNRIERINSVTLECQVFDLSPRNLAIVVYGEQSEIAEGTASEVITAYAGGYNPLKRPGAHSVAVYEDDGNGEKGTAVDESYYELDKGCLVLTEAGADLDGQTLHIEYEHGEIQVIEALRNTGYEYEATFRGTNEANGAPFAVDIHRQRFAPTDELSLIGDDFSQLQMKASVLSDAGRGAGESAFFRLQMGNAQQ